MAENRIPRTSDLSPAELEAAYFVGHGFWRWQFADQPTLRRQEADRLVESVLCNLGLDDQPDLWMYAEFNLADSPMAHA